MSSSSSVLAEAAGPVFLLGRSLGLGGTERQMVQLAIGLKQRGYDVIVGLFYCGGKFERELAGHGIPVIDLAKRHRWDLHAFMRKLVAALRQLRPSAVYSFLPTANTVAALARPFAPPFRLLWGVRASNMELHNYGWASMFAYRVERTLSGVPDLIISNSHAGLEHAALKGFPRERLTVVPNGIDVDAFRADAGLRRTMRARWQLGEDVPVVGVLARADPIKDYPTFLKAAAEVAAVRPDVRFLCIGDGEPAYLSELKQRSDALGLAGRLTWTGAAEAAPALNAIDILCSPSLGESFSNSIAEAMACARPCVVTDVGDSALIVGDTGWVVPPADPEALARALLAAVETPDDGRKGEARRRIVDNFSVAQMVERTIGLLEPAAPPLAAEMR